MSETTIKLPVRLIYVDNILSDTHQIVDVNGKRVSKRAIVTALNESDALRGEVERLTARLAMATTFELVPNRNWILGESDQRPVVIEQRPQREGEAKWVVKMHEWVLAKDGEFIWEPRPSERTDEFIALTRFDSVDEALEAYAALKGQGEQNG